MSIITENPTHKKCLLLNADYSPFGIIDWTKAIIWNLKIVDNKNSYSIEIIDFYKNDYIQGVNKRFPVPAVAKTKRFFKINDYGVNFSRKNILIRDNYTCQYCGYVFDINQLTYDHIIPKSVWLGPGSPTNWTNIVACCVKCNRKKGNKTPTEAKMRLKSIPSRPVKHHKFLPVVQSLATIEKPPEEWIAYLPKSYNYI